MITFRFLIRAVAGVIALGLAACGGGSSPTSEAPGPSQGPLASNLVLQGSHVIKMRAQGDAWLALAEKPRPHEDNTAPDRHLMMAPAGASVTVEYRPPVGWSLIDAALHPSGEASMVLATTKTLRLVRLSRQGQVVSDAGFIDSAAASDPMYQVGGPHVHDSSSLLPFATRDAVRIAAAGEGLVMALRTGRHAAVAYGLRDARQVGYVADWRTVVEPGVEIQAEAYLGAGTFDPFGGMENQFHVALDTDAQGRIGIAVSLSRTELVNGHAQMFGANALPADLQHGVLLTELRPDGQRLGTTVLDTRQISELHGLRWVGDSVVLTGRVRSEVRADGTGWDAFVARVVGGTPQVAAYSVIDIDRGDVFFDAQQLPDGRLLLSGSTGYTQNPSGRSISESSSPLLVACTPPCANPLRLTFVAGPRHNQLRALARWAGQWWVGGMDDGPGTHSDDADPGRTRSNGFIRATPI